MNGRLITLMGIIVALAVCTTQRVLSQSTPKELKADSEKGENMCLIEPFPRQEEGHIPDRNIAPCAGIRKSRTYMLSSPGALSIVQWHTINAKANGTCKIRISPGIDTEESFETLFPKDHSANSQGWFPCGRESDVYETKEIVFPDDLSCERCTLQVIWNTSNSTEYHCTDMILVSEEIKLCKGKCLNQGACVNGRCICPHPFYGSQCENRLRTEESLLWLWILILILIIIIVVLLLVTYYIRKSMKEGKPSDSLVKKGGSNQNVAELEKSKKKDNLYLDAINEGSDADLRKSEQKNEEERFVNDRPGNEYSDVLRLEDNKDNYLNPGDMMKPTPGYGVTPGDTLKPQIQLSKKKKKKKKKKTTPVEIVLFKKLEQQKKKNEKKNEEPRQQKKKKKKKVFFVDIEGYFFFFFFFFFDN
eukprot:TRINITY_DN6104_c0_g1_i1.p2 TRINITY_DN6104_c0_g1~~TRINITY_DN6104_c0_g1_i1.p2  ORF type:complete len:418 (-),score=84.75 TRINITY_DN6104_c0_g1_i1:1278-2531(-)